MNIPIPQLVTKIWKYEKFIQIWKVYSDIQITYHSIFFPCFFLLLIQRILRAKTKKNIKGSRKKIW